MSFHTDHSDRNMQQYKKQVVNEVEINADKVELTNNNQAALNNIVHGSSASPKAVSDRCHIVKCYTPTYNTVKQVGDYGNQLHAERSFAVGDNYLAGKVLIKSGSKVAFDGNRKGIDRILSIKGPQHGLIYDVLQSRCVDKAAVAIKCCDHIQNPSIALKTAFDRLEKYFDDSTRVIEAHVANVTRNEPVK